MLNRYFLYDLSYLTFHCANSAFKEYDKDYNLSSSKYGPDFDPTIDDEYVYLLEQNMETKIINSANNIAPLVNKENIIFCEDCSRKNIWRRSIYPDYKVNRDLKDTSKDKFNIGKVFSYTKMFTIPKLVEKFNCLRIQNPCAEGDDVIAITTKYILNKNPLNKVVIISSDRDMVQLCRDRVTLTTIEGKIRDPKLDMEKIIKKKIPDDVEFGAKEFVMAKIITGDSGDNIPNINRGIGPVKAYNFVIEKGQKELKKLLNEDELIKQRFQLNTKLISLNFIPKEIENDIIEEIKTQEEKKNII